MSVKRLKELDLIEVQLSSLVAKGEQVKAGRLLHRLNNQVLPHYRDIVLNKTNPKDYCRTFFNVSPIQIAEWIGDWYMQRMLISHLTDSQKAKAKKQLEAVRNVGIDYEVVLDLEGELSDEEVKKYGTKLLGKITDEVFGEIEANIIREKLTQVGKCIDELTPVIIPQNGVSYKLQFEESLPSENGETMGKTRVRVTVSGEKHFDRQPLIEIQKSCGGSQHQKNEAEFQFGAHHTYDMAGYIAAIHLAQQNLTAFDAQQYCFRSRFHHNKFDNENFTDRCLDVYDYDCECIVDWFEADFPIFSKLYAMIGGQNDLLDCPSGILLLQDARDIEILDNVSSMRMLAESRRIDKTAYS